MPSSIQFKTIGRSITLQMSLNDMPPVDQARMVQDVLHNLIVIPRCIDEKSGQVKENQRELFQALEVVWQALNDVSYN